MKNLIKNKKANANLILLSIMIVIMGFAMLTIGSYIVYAIASPLAPTGASGTQSSNTYTLLGAVNGTEFINISTGIAPYMQSCFYFNATGIGKPIGCLVIDVRSGANASNVTSATRFANAILNDTDLNPLVTVSNTVNGQVVITANNVGSAYNWAVSDTAVNGSWATSTFTGGSNAWAGLSSQNSILNYVEVVFPLFGLALMVLGFSVLLYTLRGSFGNITGR